MMETILMAGKSNKPHMGGRKTETCHTDKTVERERGKRRENSLWEEFKEYQANAQENANANC